MVEPEACSSPEPFTGPLKKRGRMNESLLNGISLNDSLTTAVLKEISSGLLTESDAKLITTYKEIAPSEKFSRSEKSSKKRHGGGGGEFKFLKFDSPADDYAFLSQLCPQLLQLSVGRRYFSLGQTSHREFFLTYRGKQTAARDKVYLLPASKTDSPHGIHFLMGLGCTCKRCTYPFQDKNPETTRRLIIDDWSPQWRQRVLNMRDLWDYKKVVTLSMSHCRLTDLTSFPILQNLQKLDLHNNMLSNVSGLTGLPQLKALNLANNWLSDLTPLGTLLELVDLNLSANRLLDLEQLKPLSQLEKLENLSLKYNRITHEPPISHQRLHCAKVVQGPKQNAEEWFKKYTAFVRDLLPSLIVLDGLDTEGEECTLPEPIFDDEDEEEEEEAQELDEDLAWEKKNNRKRGQEKSGAVKNIWWDLSLFSGLRPLRPYHMGSLPIETMKASPDEGAPPLVSHRVHIVLRTQTLLTSFELESPGNTDLASCVAQDKLVERVSEVLGTEWSIISMARGFNGLEPKWAIKTDLVPHSSDPRPSAVFATSEGLTILPPIHDIRATRRHRRLPTSSQKVRPSTAGPRSVDPEIEPETLVNLVRIHKTMKELSNIVITVTLTGELRESWEAVRDLFAAGNADPTEIACLLGVLEPHWCNDADEMGLSILHAACSVPGNEPALQEFLTAFPQANLVVRDAFGRTPAHYAAKRGYVEYLRVLWHAAQDEMKSEVLFAKDKAHRNPLHAALLWNRTSVSDFYFFEAAIGRGKELALKDITGLKPIWLALRAKVNNWWWPVDGIYDPSFSSEYLAKCVAAYPKSMTRRDALGVTLLHHAVFARRLDLVDVLCKAGAPVMGDAKGFTPLHMACSQRDMHRIIARLLKSVTGKEIEQSNCHEMSAFHYAARCGEVEYIKALVARLQEEGFDSHDIRGDRFLMKSHKGRTNFELDSLSATPLHEALLRRRKDVVQWYMFQGYFPPLQKVSPNKMRMLAAMGAICIYWPVCCIYDGDYALLDTILDMHPNLVDRQDVLGKTLLHYAASDRLDAGMVRHLLPRYTTLPLDYNGHTPLHMAARKGHYDSCLALLEKFPEGLLAESVHGTLPIHGAMTLSTQRLSRDRSIRTAKALFNFGYSKEQATAVSASGVSPLHCAVVVQDLELLESMILVIDHARNLKLRRQEFAKADLSKKYKHLNQTWHKTWYETWNGKPYNYPPSWLRPVSSMKLATFHEALEDRIDTLLHTVVKVGWMEGLECLLKSGKVEVDAVSGQKTPLGLAVSQMRPDMVRLLMEHGANPWLDVDEMFCPVVLGCLAVEADLSMKSGNSEIMNHILDKSDHDSIDPITLMGVVPLAIFYSQPPELCIRMTKILMDKRNGKICIDIIEAAAQKGLEYLMPLSELFPANEAQYWLEALTWIVKADNLEAVKYLMSSPHWQSQPVELRHRVGKEILANELNQLVSTANSPIRRKVHLILLVSIDTIENKPIKVEVPEENEGEEDKGEEEEEHNTDPFIQRYLRRWRTEVGKVRCRWEHGPMYKDAMMINHQGTVSVLRAGHRHHWNVAEMLLKKLDPPPLTKDLYPILKAAIGDNEQSMINAILDVALAQQPPEEQSKCVNRVNNLWAIEAAEGQGVEGLLSTALLIGLHQAPEINEGEASMQPSKRLSLILWNARKLVKKFQAKDIPFPVEQWKVLVLLMCTHQDAATYVELLITEYGVDINALSLWQDYDPICRGKFYSRREELPMKGKEECLHRQRTPTNYVQRTALQIACWNHNKEMVAQLLRLGASVHLASQPENLTALHITILIPPPLPNWGLEIMMMLWDQVKDSEEDKQEFLEAKASASVVYRVMEYPLYGIFLQPILVPKLYNVNALGWAVFSGNLEAVNFLLYTVNANPSSLFGATMSHPDHPDTTHPLHPITMALVANIPQFSFMDTAPRVRYAGDNQTVDIMYPPDKGVEFARSCSTTFYPIGEKAYLQEKVKIAEFILDKLGTSKLVTNINEADAFGFTAIDWTLMLGLPDLAYTLLEAGADPKECLDSKIPTNIFISHTYYHVSVHQESVELAFPLPEKFMVAIGRQFQFTTVLAEPIHIMQLATIITTKAEHILPFMEKFPDPVICNSTLPCPGALAVRYSSTEVVDILNDRPTSYGSWWALSWAIKLGRTAMVNLLLLEQACVPKCPEDQRGLMPNAEAVDLFTWAMRQNSVAVLKHLFETYGSEAPPLDNLLCLATRYHADNAASWLIRSQVPPSIIQKPVLWGCAFIMHSMEEAFDVVYATSPNAFNASTTLTEKDLEEMDIGTVDSDNTYVGPDINAAPHAVLWYVVKEVQSYKFFVEFVCVVGGMEFVVKFVEYDKADKGEDFLQEGPQLNETQASLEGLDQPVNCIALLAGEHTAVYRGRLKSYSLGGAMNRSGLEAMQVYFPDASSGTSDNFAIKRQTENAIMNDPTQQAMRRSLADGDILASDFERMISQCDTRLENVESMNMILHYLAHGEVGQEPGNRKGQSPSAVADKSRIKCRLRISVITFYAMCTELEFTDSVIYAIENEIVAIGILKGTINQKLKASGDQLLDTNKEALAYIALCVAIINVNMVLVQRIMGGDYLPRGLFEKAAGDPKLKQQIQKCSYLVGIEPVDHSLALQGPPGPPLSPEQISEMHGEHSAVVTAQTRKYRHLVGKRAASKWMRARAKAMGNQWSAPGDVTFEAMSAVSMLCPPPEVGVFRDHIHHTTSHMEKAKANIQRLFGALNDATDVPDLVKLDQDWGGRLVNLHPDRVLLAIMANGEACDQLDKAIKLMGADVNATLTTLHCRQQCDSPNILLQQRWTPLMIAAALPCAKCVETLIVNGAGVDDTTPDLLMTPLMLAAKSGEAGWEAVQVLLDANADATRISRHGQSAIHIAAGSGSTKSVECMLNACGDTVANLVNRREQTALNVAANKGFVEIVRLLIKAGANLNHQTSLGFTPLHAAAVASNVPCIMALVEAGADTNISTLRGTQAIHLAAAGDNIPTIEFLVNAGIDPNSCGEHGPVVSYAAQNYATVCQKVAALLGDYDIDIRPNGWGGKTSLMHWCGFGNEGVRKVKNLIALGANLNLQDDKGMTALHIAAGKGVLECVMTLLKAGADKNIEDLFSAKALFHATQDDVKNVLIDPHYMDVKEACANGNLKQLKELVEEEKVDINMADGANVRPLHIAALHGHTYIVEYLLENGADASKSTLKGYTPILWGHWKGDRDLIQAFETRGATLNACDKAALARRENIIAKSDPAVGQVLNISGFGVSNTLVQEMDRREGASGRTRARARGGARKKTARRGEGGQEGGRERRGSVMELAVAATGHMALGSRMSDLATASELNDFLPEGYVPTTSYFDFLDNIGRDSTLWTGPDMDTVLWDAKVFVSEAIIGGQTDIDPLHVFALFLYTYESPICYEPNRAMRLNDRFLLQKWQPAIYYLYKALTSDNSVPCQVFRGIPVKFQIDLYLPGKEVIWPSFSSTSQDYKVAEQFLSGDHGIIFIIRSKTGKLISNFSFYPTEKEVLLPPNCRFRVLKLCKPQWRALAMGDRKALTIEEASQLACICIEMEEIVD